MSDKRRVSRELRCACGKLLAKYMMVDGIIEIKCKGCKGYVVAEVDPARTEPILAYAAPIGPIGGGPRPRQPGRAV